MGEKSFLFLQQLEISLNNIMGSARQVYSAHKFKDVCLGISLVMNQPDDLFY